MCFQLLTSIGIYDTLSVFHLSRNSFDADLAGSSAMHYAVTDSHLSPGHWLELNRVEKLISNHHAPASSLWLLILEPKLEHGLRWYFGFGNPQDICCEGHTYWISRHVCRGPDIGENGLPPSIVWYVSGFKSLCAFHDNHLVYRSSRV